MIKSRNVLLQEIFQLIESLDIKDEPEINNLKEKVQEYKTHFVDQKIYEWDKDAPVPEGFVHVVNPRDYTEIEDYYINEQGDIWSTKSHRLLTYHYLYGYALVGLSLPYGTRIIAVHRLLAATFIPNPKPDINDCIDHIDGDRTNNSLSNLRWCTRSENTKFFHENQNNENYKGAKLKRKYIPPQDRPPQPPKPPRAIKNKPVELLTEELKKQCFKHWFTYEEICNLFGEKQFKGRPVRSEQIRRWKKYYYIMYKKGKYYIDAKRD